MDRSIKAPDHGLYYNGPQPVTIEVREVPSLITDDVLSTFIEEIASSQRGLQLGTGVGGGGLLYSIHWKELQKCAADRGIKAPNLPAPPSRPNVKVHVAAGRLCNENGLPIGGAGA